MLTNRFFLDDNFFKGEEGVRSDIYEKDGNIIVEMEAPGYTKEDISISIDKGELSVTFHRERKSYSKLTRTFYLGDVDEDNLTASFKNGVLTVKTSKNKEIETKKTIDIVDSE